MKHSPFVALCILLSTVLQSTNYAQQSRPPGLLYSTLLNGIQLNERTGSLRLDRIQAVFLPKVESNDAWQYNMNDGKLTARLLRDDETLMEFRFYAQPIRGVFWQLGGYQAKNPSGQQIQDVQLREEGEYKLVFELENKQFYVYPFTVSISQNDNEFDPQPRYHLEGDWRNLGYLFYAEANPRSNISFKLWLRDKDKQDAYRSDKVDVEIRDEAGKLIAAAGTKSKGTTYQLKQAWVRYTFELYSPETIEAVKASQILAQDGDYTIDVTVNGKAWAKFPFTVKSGAIDKQGRQLKDSTDPEVYIEGGRDAWWLEAKK